MAEKPVVVPVDLEVKELKMDKVDFNSLDNNLKRPIQKMQKTLMKLLSDTKNVDLGKSISTSMIKVQNTVTQAAAAYNQLHTAMATAGKNSDKYKEGLKALLHLQDEIAKKEKITNQYREAAEYTKSTRFPDTNIINEYNKQIKELQDLKNQAERLQQVLNNPINFVSFGKENDLQKIDSLYVKLISKIKEANYLGKEFNTTVGENKYTDEFAKNVKELEKFKGKFEKLQEKINRFNERGASNEQWENLNYDIQKTNEEFTELLNKMHAMTKEGKDFRFDLSPEDMVAFNDKIQEMMALRDGVIETSSEADRLRASLGKTRRESITAGEFLKRGFKLATKTAHGLVKVLKKVTHALHSIVSGIVKAAKHLKVFHKEGNKTSFDLTRGFNKLKKSLLMYVFGFRSAYYAIKRLRNVFISAFKTMATQHEEINQQISKFIMALNRLKGSIGTAFQPIVSVALPIINDLMEKLSQAMEIIGKFFATLTGQKYIYKAVSNQVDFAKSLEDTGDAAEETQKKLASYDKLDVIDDDNTKDDKKNKDNNNLLDVTYEKVPIGNAVADFINRLKEAWKNQDFSALGKLLSDKILKLLDNIQQNVIPKITDFINRLANAIVTFIDGFDFKAVGAKIGSIINDIVDQLDAKRIGEALASIYNMFWRFADGLVNEINWSQLGHKLGEFVLGFVNKLDINAIINTISGLFNGISDLILGFADTIPWGELGQRVSTKFSEFINKLKGKKFGNAIATLIADIIDLIYQTISNFKVEDVTKFVTDIINTFFSKLAETDKNGLNSWAKLAKSISGLATGLLEFLTNTISEIDWTVIGQSIGDFISNIDWSKIAIDLKNLAWAILTAISEGLKSWHDKEPISATLATMLMVILVSSKVIDAVKVITDKINSLPKLSKNKVKGTAIEDSTNTVSDAADSVDDLNTSTSTLTSKLTNFAKNLALGIAIIAEVIVAVGLVVAAVWGLGKGLEQVGKAWKPVLENGATVTDAIIVGTGIILGIGAATDALGTAGAPLAGIMGIGIGILAEIGVAAGLFIAEIWGVGKGLTEILKAWKPVLDNGKDVAKAIGVGTGLLVGVGAAAAALGTATVASAGLLPVAIGLGTALLVELAGATKAFCDSLIKVANKLIELYTPLTNLNKILPTLKTDMKNFTSFMKEFASAVVSFTKINIITGIASTIDKIVGVFKTNPIKTMHDEISRQTGEFRLLVAALKNIIPTIQEATNLVNNYKTAMGSFENSTGGKRGFLNSIISGSKTAVNSMIAMFEGMANGVIRCVNAIATAINNLSFDIPDWVPDVGGQRLVFNIPKASEVRIPRLAQGAVIPPNKEFLAMLGDQKSGTNVEAPLDTIKQAVAEVLAELGSVQHDPIILQLSGKTVAKVVWDETEKRYKQTGKSFAY